MLTEKEVGICNLALARIGEWVIDYNTPASINGNVANKCGIHYEQTRNALLRSFNWNFAAGRIILISDWKAGVQYNTDQYVWKDGLLYKCTTAHTSTVWRSNYIYDGAQQVYDGLVPLIDSQVVFYWEIITERPEFKYSYKYLLPADFIRFSPELLRKHRDRFTIEGNYILTNEPYLEIQYTKKITDPDSFDPLFTEVLKLDLAINLLNTLAGAKSQDVEDRLERKRQIAMSKARCVCDYEINQGGESKWLTARYGSGKV